MADNDGADILDLLDALPFMQVIADDDADELAVYWQVEPTGDFDTDLQTGRNYAVLVYKMDRQFPDCELVPTIINAIMRSGQMVHGGRWGTIEAGFMEVVVRRSRAGGLN